MLKDIVSNVVNAALTQHGLGPAPAAAALPSDVQQGLFSDIGGIYSSGVPGCAFMDCWGRVDPAQAG